MKKISLLLLFTIASGGCALVEALPPQLSQQQRYESLKALQSDDGEISVYWSDNAVPFIVAQNDEDAAYGLGVVHAHLRLGQMEVFRNIARGRTSAMLGLVADTVSDNLDITVRALDFGRVADAVYQQMPEATRRWLDAYVLGINAVKQNAQRPWELSLATMDEPWSATDVITIVRLSGFDVHWLAAFELLKWRNSEKWNEIWQTWHSHMQSSGVLERPIGGHNRKTLHRLSASLNKSGSNSWAVKASRSATGGALLANDVHLSLMQPNAWVFAGIQSPGFRAVGATLPGIPAFFFGRNPDLSWGGTHMRAAVSDLVRVASSSITVRASTLHNESLGDRVVSLYDSNHGPLLNSIPQLSVERTAIKWIGHKASDEITALLGVMRARNGEQARAALKDFALPSYNFVYAEKSGSIGHIFATHIPARSSTRRAGVTISSQQAQRDWKVILTAEDLPHIRDPKSGLIVSANNRPEVATSAVVGWYFSNPQRRQRALQLLQEKQRLSVKDLKTYLLDVYSLRDDTFSQYLVGLLDEHKVTTWLLPRMRSWDGHYDKESTGAPAYEAFLYGLGKAIEFDGGLADRSLGAFYMASDIAHPLWMERLQATGGDQKKELLTLAARFGESWLDPAWTWGDINRVYLRHTMGYLAPLMRKKLSFGNMSASGSLHTIHKSIHPHTNEPHEVYYGPQARHISDMSDEDANYFILFGGQDGWLKSRHNFDQISLWQKNEYIQLPLQLPTVKRMFAKQMRLKSPLGAVAQ